MQKTFQPDRPIANRAWKEGDKAYTLSEAHIILQKACNGNGDGKMPVRYPVLAEGKAAQ